MPKINLVTLNDAIEGLKIKGSSRHPLKSLGMVTRSNPKLYSYTASFDVRAEIDECVSSATIIPGANINQDCEIIADKVKILSYQKIAPRQRVQHRSSTHKATFWAFSSQTAVQISIPQKSISDAQKKLSEKKFCVEENLLTRENKTLISNSCLVTFPDKKAP